MKDDWTFPPQTFPPVSSGVESRRGARLGSGPPTLSRQGREAAAEKPVPRAVRLPGAAAESGEPGATAGSGGGGRTERQTHPRALRPRPGARLPGIPPARGAAGPAGPGRAGPGAPPPPPATPAHSGARDWLRPPLAARRSPPPSQLKQTVPGAERARREHGPRAAAAPAPAPPPPSPPQRISPQLQPRPRLRSVRPQPRRSPRLSAAPARSPSREPGASPNPAAAAAAGRGRGRCCRSRRRRRRLDESRAAPRIAAQADRQEDRLPSPRHPPWAAGRRRLRRRRRKNEGRRRRAGTRGGGPGSVSSGQDPSGPSHRYSPAPSALHQPSCAHPRPRALCASGWGRSRPAGDYLDSW